MSLETDLARAMHELPGEVYAQLMPDSTQKEYEHYLMAADQEAEAAWERAGRPDLPVRDEYHRNYRQYLLGQGSTH